MTDREEYTKGLRALADLLDANPTFRCRITAETPR